jgi:type II secretory pathway component PulF
MGSKSVLPAPKRLLFFNHLLEMVHSGITVIEAIRNFETSDKALKSAANKVGNALTTGRGFYESLQGTGLIDGLTGSVLRSGERSGLLDEALEEVVTSLENQVQFQQQLKEALTMPCFNIVAATIAVLYLSMSVIPKVGNSLRSLGDLPEVSQMIFDTADTLASNWYVVVGGLVAVVVGIILAFRRKPAFMYRIPVIGDIFRYQLLAVVFNNLAVGYKSGTPIIECLAEMERILSGYGKERLRLVIRDMRRGSHLDIAMGKSPDLFPRDIISMVKTARISGNYDRLLNGVSKLCRNRAFSTAKKLGSMISPIVIMAVALVVAAMALAIYYPIADIGTNFK